MHTTYRSGFGYDVHRLVEGRPLILGGVEVPFERGLEGHSDADVLLHALIDAILGAAGEGDIGTHYPSSDPALKGISSATMLAEMARLVRGKGWHVENIDATIVAQRPRLSPHTPRMKARIAEVLEIEPERVNVKSKTTDGLGFTGTGEGMAAYCTVMLSRA
ncbi:MAG: 2-C-methyl-D-erythritol 2,4-cyclodiphosphate synthase [Chloroflexota bacterium]|nr:2-C-methyl-D-erythritol 2,4-cyclodiphosphate synthase [Chloroflexota bacterium]MDQ5867039.1 2-C-methyl-D-erythritol 2,4-cyclodiphosphate synthase [Chloroflexota bacterium]